MTTTNSKVYLCHKCSGALTGNNRELYGCGCMSGWVRDWQTPVTLEQAKAEQAKLKEANREYYRKQGRSEAEIASLIP